MDNKVNYSSEGAITIQEKSQLQVQGDDITDKIIKEDDPKELDRLTQLFALNQKKKQIVRTNKLSNLLDKVDNEIISRVENTPYAIEDRDLIKYWSTTSDIVSGKSEEDMSMPKIQINNQTNINVNSSGLSRESRAKVLDVVNSILNGIENDKDIINAEIRKVDK